MRLVLPLLAAALIISPARAEEPALSVAHSLAWMSGNWVEEHEEGRWTEEYWLPPRGELVLGVNRSGNEEGATGFEFFRIAPGDDGSTYYYASPGGRESVAFRLVALDEFSATFENPTHDYPTTIRYRREGDTLHAEISGPDGANPMSWTFRLSR